MSGKLTKTQSEPGTKIAPRNPVGKTINDRQERWTDFRGRCPGKGFPKDPPHDVGAISYNKDDAPASGHSTRACPRRNTVYIYTDKRVVDTGTYHRIPDPDIGETDGRIAAEY